MLSVTQCPFLRVFPFCNQTLPESLHPVLVMETS